MSRKGVCYLDIPDQILQNKIKTNEQDLAPSLPKPVELPTTASITQAVDLLTKAQRPVFIIGRGVRWDNAYEELKYLIEEFSIPFTTSPMAQGFISDRHSLCYNSINAQLFAQADVIVVIGARLNWTFRFGAEFPENTKLIHIDIHPSEIGNNISPTIGIIGEANKVLQQIPSQLKNTQINIDQSWLKSLDHHREQKLQQWNLLAEDNSLPISPHRLIKEIREVLPQDTIVSIDGRVTLATAQRLLPSYLPVSRFTPGTNGCMGVGIPFAVGAKMAQPQRPVVVVTGDLAFGLNGMEMETAIRYNLPIVVIVLNNEGNTGCLIQKKWYPADYPDRVAMFQPNIHYEKMMEIFGGKGEYVEEISQIKPALIRALDSNFPTCINVRVNQETPYPSK